MGKFIEAVLILAGMIIGVGMFGIPFSFVRAGFWTGMLELLLLAGVVLAVHLLYAEIILATRRHHRLPGYVREYLGDGAYRFSLLSFSFGLVGSLLAYLIVGARFLGLLLAPFSRAAAASDLSLVVVLVLVAALITWFPLRKEALVNGVITAILIAFLLALSIILLPRVEPAHLTTISRANVFAPYGVVLFALLGAVVVPDVIERLGHDRRLARRAIVIGSLLPAFLYALFALAIVGMVGPGVSEEAISGLGPVVGGSALWVGALVGFLAIFTSLVALGTSAQAFLRLDLGVPRRPAWFLVALVPFLLYLVGFQSFILVIGLVGAVAGGADILLTLLTHHRLRARQGVQFSAYSYGWKAILFLMIIGGMIYELIW